MQEVHMDIELPVSNEVLFHAWLDSKEHSLFTGAEAVIDPHKEGEFTAWDGYISGKTMEVDPPNRILQSWRTTEFAEEDPDSQLEIRFVPMANGTKLYLDHTNIPEGQAESYRQGWQDFYFTPMQQYYQSHFPV